MSWCQDAFMANTQMLLRYCKRPKSEVKDSLWWFHVPLPHKTWSFPLLIYKMDKLMWSTMPKSTAMLYPEINLIKLWQVQFTSVTIVLSLTTIATLVNYTCKNLVKLSPSHLVLHFCHLSKMCVKKCPNPGTSSLTLNAAIMAWRRVWLICGKPQRQMWSWIRDIPFFNDMNLGTAPTNAPTSYRTTNFLNCLGANLRLEVGQRLQILLVYIKTVFLRPGNVTAGFRQSGTKPHLNDASTILVITKRNIIRVWQQSSWPVRTTHRIVTDVRHSNLKLHSGKLESGNRSITQVVFWRRSCLSKGFSLMIMGILLQLLLSTWISFHTSSWQI